MLLSFGPAQLPPQAASQLSSLSAAVSALPVREAPGDAVLSPHTVEQCRMAVMKKGVTKHSFSLHPFLDRNGLVTAVHTLVSYSQAYCNKLYMGAVLKADQSFN